MRGKKQNPDDEEGFVNLMMAAGQFMAGRDIAAAKQGLQEAGDFIAKAGGLDQALQALDVLESLKAKLVSPSPVKE